MTDPLIVNADATDLVNTTDRMLLGGKGASLFWMASQGVPVPPFFVLTTRAWRAWQAAGRLPQQQVERVMDMIGWLEKNTGRAFGVGPRPLLVSVRSTGPVSMPGMMDTILNLGLTPSSLGALLDEFGDLRMVADVITNFVASATPVLGARDQRGTEATGGTRQALPLAAEEQLVDAIDGVFASWNNERARLYRRMNRIPDDYGTAVVVQAMVFGNAGESSGTGVLFTRDPVTGERVPRGEWLAAAQGEAVVSGRATPFSIALLRDTQPEVYRQLVEIAGRLERSARQPQDIEFTVERGRLFLLQTRALKSAPLATCRIVLDLLEERVIDRTEAVRRLSEMDLSELWTDVLRDPGSAGPPVATGLAAAPGVATGTVVREIDTRGGESPDRPLVLLRPETSPHDLPAMRRASALVTEKGGLTSHAAIVARALRIPCVVGCGALDRLSDGEDVTVDGGRGAVYRGRLTVDRTVPDVVRRAQALVREEQGRTS
ncbi:MAG TPA: pyruvate, phosphate dikinase [Pseudonocardiaceae bacterium]